MLTGNADVIPESLKKGNSPGLFVHLAQIFIMIAAIAGSLANGRCATLAKFLACGMFLSAGWHHTWGNRNETLAGVVFAAVVGYSGFARPQFLPATKWQVGQARHRVHAPSACLMGATALTLLSGSSAALPTALKTLNLGATQAIGKDLLLAAIPVLAGALDNSAPTICKVLHVAIGWCQRGPMWTAMDRVRAAGSVILWIGK